MTDATAPAPEPTAAPAPSAAPAPADHPPARRYLPALDGLRALAIFVVVVHNVTTDDGHEGLAQKLWIFFTDAGWIGVQLFFVLSGYLITNLLLDGRDRPHPYRTFYLRRALRIFPIYYLFLAGRFLVLPLFIPELGIPFSEQIWYWLYLSNWLDAVLGGRRGLSHFWSLAVEEQFYVIWPALAGRVRDRTFAWVCVGIAVAALASRIALRFSGIDHVWMYVATIARADGLALGALVALAMRSARGTALYARARGPVLLVAGAAMLAIMAQAHGLSRYNPLVQSVGYSILAVLFAILVAECVQPELRRGLRWLAHPALVRVGRYSYAIYLFHLPIRFIFFHYWREDIVAASARHPIPVDVALIAVVAVLSFLAAALSYVAIERPILALKERWAPA